MRAIESFGHDRPLPPPAERRGPIEGAECWRCPFARDNAPTRPVRGEGPNDPAWILIGEGPGRNEALLERPFVGASGAVIDKVLMSIGRKRPEVWITNGHACQPFEGADEKHKQAATSACSPRLRAELRQFPGKPILSVGAATARLLLPEVFAPPVKEKQPEPATPAAPTIPVGVSEEVPSIRPGGFDPPKSRFPNEPTVSPSEAWALWGGKGFQKTRKRAKAAVDKHGNKPFTVVAAETKKSKTKKAKKPRVRRPKGQSKNRGLTFSDIVSTLHTTTFCGDDDPRQCIPTIHPAAILRSSGKALKGAHSADLVYWNLLYDTGKLDALAKGIDVVFTEDVVTEFVDQAQATKLVIDIVRDARDCGELAVDLETTVDDEQRHHALMMYVAQIKAIGLATPERGVSVMWNCLGPLAKAALRDIFADPKVVKIFHNGLYDRTVLRARGFVLSDAWADSLLAHHATFPGMAHKLQLVAGQFFAIRPWKSEFRDSDETPESLTKYCLMAGTPVTLADGTTMSIERIVQQRLPVDVLSLSPDGQIQAKRVVGWHQQRVANQAWVQIKVNAGYTTGRGLVTTPDHKIFTQRGKIDAAEVRVDDLLFLPESKLSDEQRQAMLGTLLGDSILVASPSNRSNPSKACRLAFSGGHSSPDLVRLKTAAIPALIKCGAPRSSRVISVNGRVGVAGEFYPLNGPMSYQLADLWGLINDSTGRRLLVSTLDQLGAPGLAWWFMDDGCRQNGKYNNDSVVIATQRYSVDDVAAAKEWFCARFGKTYVGADRYLRLSAEASRRFCTFIAPFVPDPLRYKFPVKGVDHPWPEYRGVQQPTSTAPVERRVTSVAAYTPNRATRSARAKADTRFCLSVEDNQNFFTTFGLVSNCALDTLTTARLRSPLEILVKKTKTEKVYEMDRCMAEIASHMHLWGVPVNRDKNEELLQTFRVNVREAREAIDAVANDKEVIERIKAYVAMEEAHTVRGPLVTRTKNKITGEVIREKVKRPADPDDYRQRHEIRLRELNDKVAKGEWAWSVDKGTHVVGLLKALGVNLWQKTDSGRTATTKAILEELVDVPIVRKIVSYRENSKLLSTFVWSIFDRFDGAGNQLVWGYADERDRVHPSWSVTKISGRWASTEPVLSNVPKDDNKRGRPNLRAQVIAPPGRMFVGFDFGQLEARGIALVSGDPWLCDVFAKGLDVHTEAMKVVWGPKVLDLKANDPKTFKRLRDAVKRFEYGAFYGGSVETLWKTLLKDDQTVKLADVAAAVNLLMTAMPNVVQWQNDSVIQASRPPNEIRSFLLGRRRVFPLVADRNEAINIGIQSLGADIMDTGMWRMWQRLPKYKGTCFPILQIHDAAIFECDEDDADRVKTDVIECFTQEYERAGTTIPFPIEVDIAASWDKC